MRITAIILVCSLLSATSVFAQDGGKPVMENVFFNVVWGSAAGAMLGGAVAIIGAKDKESPGNVSAAGFQGATLGGIVGLGLGIYLVFTGISFDPDRSTISRPNDGFAHLPPTLPPFAVVTSKDDPLRITGFQATVLDFRF